MMIIACLRCSLQYDVRSYPEGTRLQCRCGEHLTVPAHQVTAVRCPSCGGTVDATVQRCKFCQTLIARKTCPACFAGLRDVAKFCDQCGTALRALSEQAAQAVATAHSCPRCKVPLFSQTCSGYPMESCAECLGLWLDHGTLEHIYQDAPKRLEAIQAAPLAVADPSAGRERLGAGAARYIPCPVCQKIMNPVNYARRSGIVIDVCKDHGTWFDADELNQILEFCAKGGLERARQRDLAEATQQLRQERVALQVRQAAPTHVTTGSGTLLVRALGGLLS